MTAKRTILVFVGYYLPGFKAGGIPRSVENIVNHLHKEFRFLIVTRDRDFGDDLPYSNINENQWQQIGNANVYYLSRHKESIGELARIIREVSHDLFYLNSFFDPLTIKVLMNLLLRRIERKPILVAPRGEFASASLRLKHPRKVLFMTLAKMVGLYRHVNWHAASDIEASDIASVMKVPADQMRIALDLPTRAYETDNYRKDMNEEVTGDSLRVIFLSRISPEKNLGFALKVLRECRARIAFDIAGPIQDVTYWKECEKLIADLPPHVQVRYLGVVQPARVIATLQTYDLFLFPSGGESYGHVIVEALTAGTPVLISTNTPWRSLKEKGLGWDLPLADIGGYVRVVDGLFLQSTADRHEHREQIRARALQLLTDPAVLQSNRSLFHQVLS